MNAQDTSKTATEEPPHVGSENCLPLGTHLAEFEINGIVGEGGFGIVYLAFDHSLQRTVAIKEYMPGSLAGRSADKSVEVRASRHQETFDKGLKSFINEARLLAQFDHPALIKVYRFWEQNKTGYMAMQYYDGQTLKSIVKSDPAFVTEAWLKSILKPILEALDTLYRVKILHRDISPDNIMIQPNGQAVLLDFGAARQIISNITQSFTVILKPGYAPVEQYADDDSLTQGAWTDIYSLSAVIYSAIAKKAPPTSVARMIKDPIEILQNGTYPGFSKEFLAAIDKGLAVRPEDRPQSIDEFRKLLGIGTGGAARAEVRPMPLPSSDRSNQQTNKNGKARSNVAPSKGTPGKSRSGSRDATPSMLGGMTKRAQLLGSVAIALAVGVGAYLIGSRDSAPGAGLTLVAPAPGDAAAGNPQTANAAPLQAEQTLDEETVAWQVLKDDPKVKPEDLESFVGKYPSGKYAVLARTKLAALKMNDSANTTASKSGAETAGEKIEKPVGVLGLTIKPWGTVMVDGFSKGVSPPLKKLVLAEGKHQVKIVNPNFPDHVVEIEISRKKLGNIDYNFSPAKK